MYLDVDNIESWKISDLPKNWYKEKMLKILALSNKRYLRYKFN